MAALGSDAVPEISGAVFHSIDPMSTPGQSALGSHSGSGELPAPDSNQFAGCLASARNSPPPCSFPMLETGKGKPPARYSSITGLSSSRNCFWQ